MTDVTDFDRPRNRTPINRRFLVMADGTHAEVVAAVPPATMVHGQVTVTTPGTAEPLAEEETPLYRCVFIRALSTNTGIVYVGGEDVDSDSGHELEVGDLIAVEVADLSTVYVDAAEAGEGVSFIGS